MMAITSKILSIEVTENPEKMTYKAGETFDASGMKVVAKLANGLERDITNYVTWQEGRSNRVRPPSSSPTPTASTAPTTA